MSVLTLPNGFEVNGVVFQATKIELKNLLEEGEIEAVKKLMEKANDPEFRIGDYTMSILQDTALCDSYGRIYGDVLQIIRYITSFDSDGNIVIADVPQVLEIPAMMDSIKNLAAFELSSLIMALTFGGFSPKTRGYDKISQFLYGGLSSPELLKALQAELDKRMGS